MQESKVKTQTGRVISKSGDKSIKVQIEFKVKHPIYNKYVSKRTKVGVHDKNNEAGIGDKVLIGECRPISKTKNWRLLEILEKAVVK